LTFKPEEGYTLDPTPIGYTLTDTSTGLSDTATVVVDYVPGAVNDESLFNTAGLVTVNVLANDTLGDTVDPSTLQIVGTDDPGDPLVVVDEGTWTVDLNTGEITFTPEVGFTGQ